MYSPPYFPPLYFVTRGNLLIYNKLSPLFAKQRGDLGVSTCISQRGKIRGEYMLWNNRDQLRGKC